MRGTEAEIDERVFKIGDSAAGQLIAELVPWLVRAGFELAPVKKDVSLIGIELERKTALKYIARAAQILKPGQRIAESQNYSCIAAETKPLAQAPLLELA